MTRLSQEVERIEQLLTNPRAIDIKEHKPVGNVENYLLAAMRNMLEYWYNDVNA